MTAIYMDGFEHYGSGTTGARTNMLQGGVWVQSTLGVLQTPTYGARTGTLALTGGDTLVGNATRMVLPGGALSHMFHSQGFSVEALPSGNLIQSICTWRTSGNGIIARLWCQSDGSAVLTDGSNTFLAGSSGPVFQSRKWHFLEMEFNRSAGNFVLRVDDAGASLTPAINASGLSLGSSDVGQMSFIEVTFAAANPVGYVDDLFIRNTSGSVNNSWIGDRRIATLLPDGDTTTAGWTPNFYHNIGTGIEANWPGNACITAATATALNVGNSDFTLEGFVRFAGLPTTGVAVIFNRWDETNNQRSYQLLFGGASSSYGNNLVFRYSTDGHSGTVTQAISYPWVPDLDTWYHIAIVRASAELLLFVNGQQFGLPIADSNTYFAGTAPWALGAQVEGTSTVISSTYLSGWFDEVRFTNGFARYTTNFTPTTTLFPRGSLADPEWSDVVLLAGFDSVLQDESGFNRVLTARNGAFVQIVTDGPAVGTFSTINKIVPDDSTFISAPFLSATSILTLNSNPSAGNSVTVGTKDGATAAVYTFRTSLSSAFDVLIDSSIQQTLQNLYNAINAGPGAGTKYGTGTTSNFDVNAIQLPAGQMEVSANLPGTAGNSIASTSSGISGGWTGTHLAGGTNIPGPSNFKVQRLPANVTIISAVQIVMRAFKSDAGVGTINSGLVGALGGVTTGTNHSLTVNPDYYNDVFETDPDTSGPISPTTITNGAIQINRDT